ncbi:hypothetical protein A4A49_30796 [Nicotiana attenuata]|uniref:Uncharacterized protein n=1 Tax=Nicotiana attenuata TaxID=49451 RepID=A0A1J6IRJ5_NICAT|nr:hypothetical protein A4A49_30796 [Nicotiana attenuata]
MARRTTYRADHLVKIGIEGFAMADEEYGQNPNKRLHREQPHQEPQSYKNATLIPTQFFNWRKFVTTPRKESRDVMDCNQAAEVYGGVLIKKVILFRKGY